MGFNCLKTTEPLRGVSLLFTSISPEVPGTNFTNLGRMRGWVWPWSHTQQILHDLIKLPCEKISYIEKMKIITQIVFEILKFKKSCNLIDEEHFPRYQISQKHIANYGTSFKAQKVMMPPLKCQIFWFWSKFVSFTRLSRQQIQFSKIWLCQFLVYMRNYPHEKKLRNPTE